MSKKLYFLISFVLVLSLGGLAQADAIEVNNPSFEIAADGVNTVPGHRGYDGIKDWSENYPTGGDTPGWVGVDVHCPYVDPCVATPEHCHRWPGSDGGVVYSYLQNVGTNAYQVLDMNNSDANGVIVAGRSYTLTVDALVTQSDEPTVIELSFFYPEDVCKPDVNHFELASASYPLEYIERPLGDCGGESILDPTDECPDWDYNLPVTFVAETTDDCIGKTLGIKFTAPFPDGERYSFIDNVRVEWSWASTAYDPDPADEAEDVPIDVNLSWSPGLWAVNDVNGHEVYFGTSWAEVDSATTATTGIYRGTGVGVVSGPDVNNRYSYDALETLELGKAYYWRIDEVNEDWLSGPVPPVNDRWKGDVWSFRTTGLAYNVYPADGAKDIPALNLTLRWTAGDSADEHDVYFGSDEAAVEAANTADTTGVYRSPRQALADVNYPVEALEVDKDYFWRIDEVNAAILVKGDVWSFTTGSFLLVDGFEWYQTHQEIRAVWKDYWSGSLGGKNGAEVRLMTEADDANKILDYQGQSMEYYFRCYLKIGAAYQGSMAEADTADLEIGSDWTIGGVKALVVNFCGDPCNLTDTYGPYQGINPDQMWVALSDDTNEGLVQYPKMGDIADASWHEWNISLIDPNFSSVDMSNVAKVYIGFGGQKIGQNKAGAGASTTEGDTVWFDEIRLYPPRCMPEAIGLDNIHKLGDFTGPDDTEDCNTDYLDLELMGRDWASIDGLANTENRPAILTGFPDSTSHWTTDCAVGTGAIEVNEPYKITVDDPRLFGLESMSITAWIKQTIDNDWTGIVSSRESYPGCGDDASEIGVYGKAYGGPDGLGYDWSCGDEEWQFDAGLDVPEDGTWTFIAVSVDPTGASLYMKPKSGSLQIGTRNTDAHDLQKNFRESFIIGRSKPDGGYFVGKIDDVRIYGYNLDDANVTLLANETGEPNPPPVYWYKFDETSGLSAADYGTPIEVYTMNMSPANVVPKDPCDSEDPNLGTNAFDPNNMDIVNFLDYKFMAEHWLEQHPWP